MALLNCPECGKEISDKAKSVFIVDTELKAITRIVKLLK